MKEGRQIIFNKHKGRCAYCGCFLVGSWHIDHITPRANGGSNDLDNLNPSCKECNNYKGANDLEGFRTLLVNLLNLKLEYLFKSKTKMQVAINLGVVTLEKWDGKFYFEQLKL